MQRLLLAIVEHVRQLATVFLMQAHHLFTYGSEKLGHRRTVARLPGLFDGVVRFFHLLAHLAHRIHDGLAIFLAQLADFFFLLVAELQLAIEARRQQRHPAQEMHLHRAAGALLRRTAPGWTTIVGCSGRRIVVGEEQQRSRLDGRPRLAITA